MAGRCAGCGHAGSTRNVQIHILTCTTYIELYHSEPDRCLDPAAEYARHKTEDDARERADRRDQRLQTRFADLKRQHHLQTQRWKTPKDILED